MKNTEELITPEEVSKTLGPRRYNELIKTTKESIGKSFQIVCKDKTTGEEQPPVKFATEKEMNDYLLARKDLFDRDLFDRYDVSLQLAISVDTGILQRLVQRYKQEDGEGLQQELFGVFDPKKTALYLERKFALNFGNVARIRDDYKKHLKIKLTSGRTLGQHLDDVEAWYNTLHGEDLGNWIKLFAFVKAIKEQTEKAPDTSNLIEERPGVYRFYVKTDAKFFRFFIKPDKKTRQFTTKAKAKFLKWLSENRNAIRFPIITAAGVLPDALTVFDYRELITLDGKTDLIFLADTNILASAFNDYVSIDIEEVDLINDEWENMAAANPDFAKLRLNNFVDLPLKFLLTLKMIYSPKGNYTTETTGWKGNGQRLGADKLDEHLGGLKGRVHEHAKKRHIAGEKTSGKIDELITLLLNTTFAIAIQRNWIKGPPVYADRIYSFNINAAYFAPLETFKRLTGPGNP